MILVIFFFISCSKEEKYDLYISTVNYNLNVKTGEFKIDWYKNYTSNIEFSKNEKERLNELIYKYSIENLKGENYVFGKENLIMPNFNEEITLKKGNKLKSKIHISTQVNLTESKLTKTEVEIYKFKQELFILLNKNKDFKKNMDTLEIAKKNDNRLFL
ncbi:MAG: hypothetical protein H7195_06320 [Chryseobacterium sp.]|nr:hypothetical protein [Chryseobacterium sp.]